MTGTDTSGESAIEVVLMWGDSYVLHVAHLSPLRDFYIGEGGHGDLDHPVVDYLFGQESLGVREMPVVVRRGDGHYVFVPEGAQLAVARDDVVGPPPFDVTGASPERLSSFDDLPGGRALLLVDGQRAHVRFREFVFVVRYVDKGDRIGKAPVVALRDHVSTMASLAFHLALIAFFYFVPPASTSLSMDRLEGDSRLIGYVVHPPEVDPPKEARGDTGGDHKPSGDPSAGESGTSGAHDAPTEPKRSAVRGRDKETRSTQAREPASSDARRVGILGVLHNAVSSLPSSPFNQALAGSDEFNAIGALLADAPGWSRGTYGLGPNGTGRGARGNVDGAIGAGDLPRIGPGGPGGPGDGYGPLVGTRLRDRQSNGPRPITPHTSVVGALSKETIRRIVRQHHSEVRFCYEQALARRPDLAGRVTVVFTITPQGVVQSALARESSVHEREMESCLALAVRRWTFPSPEDGGLVTVEYPFMFSPSGG